MKKEQFVKIINSAIAKTISVRGSDFTCCNISEALMDEGTKISSTTHPLRLQYAEMFGVQDLTFTDLLESQEYSKREIKNTRIAALTLFKVMMLDTKGYEEIKL